LIDAADDVFLDALFEPLASVLRTLHKETSSVPDIRSHALLARLDPAGGSRR